MIKNISFSNFKGQTGVQELTGRDIIIGPNGSGKSTRVQALGLSMLGYTPGEGKTEAETMKMATGDCMAVGLQTNGFNFERQFTKSGAKVSQSIRVSPGKGETTDTMRKQRIADEVGNFPVMLDFNEFLGLTDTKRRDFIYSLSTINSETWTKERVEQTLLDELCALGMRVEDEESYALMRQTIEDAMAQYPDGWAIADGLQAMIDWTTEQLKLWKTKQKDAQGAVRQIAEAKNSLEQTDRNIAGEKAELEQLQTKLVELEKQISQDTERKRIVDQRMERIAELKGQISELEAAPVETVDIAELQAAIAEAKGKIEQSNFSEEIDALTKVAGEAAVAEEDARQRADAIKEKNIQINAGMVGLAKSLETINGLGGHCIVDARIGCEKDFTKFRAFVEQKKAEATEAAAQHKADYEAVSSEIKQYQDQECDAKQRIAELVSKERQTNLSNRLINEQIAGFERQLNEAATVQERRANQIGLFQEELTRLMNQPAEAIASLDVLSSEVSDIRIRISELKSSIDEKTKARQTIILMQQSMLENKTAEMKVACLKSLSEALGPKGIQGELVKEILEPIRTDIGANLKLMGFDHEPFFQTESETGKEIFQFGWTNEHGHKVNFDALSTGQQMIFLAAMMLVIVGRANPKTKVLVLDNLNHLDRMNFELILMGLSHVSGVDNIILAGAIGFPFEAPEGWKVWDLGKTADVVEDGEKIA